MVSFNSYSSDDSPDNPEMGWRVLAKVGSTIYASDLIKISTSSSTKSVMVSDPVWHVWAGETNLRDGFNIAYIKSGSGTPLPAGNISDFGVLAIDHETRDRFRIDDFSINGTVVPEPATLGMVAALGGGMLFIRRRFMI